ncbi:SPOSA6832_04791, partial [Sporobolomyces salmonicolor]
MVDPRLKLLLVLVVGAVLRLLLVHARLPVLLTHRNELTSPLSSWQRLQEGYHLFTRLGLNPYAAGSFHAPPLLLACLGPFSDSATVNEGWSYAVWTLADLVIAWAVARLAERRRRSVVLEEDGERRWSGAKIAAMSVDPKNFSLFEASKLNVDLRRSYLLHPFSVATTLARSSTVFSNLFLALALESAVAGSLLSSVFLLSLATHLSLYPILLLPPLLIFAHHMRSPNGARRSLKSDAARGALAFVAHQALLLGASRWLTGSWDFISSVYGVILIIPDLTPNIGVAWYFFIEMFDHFRSFFLVVFALHPIVYVAPLTYFYRKDALFAIVLLVGSLSLLKSYPTLGDYALWHALLGCYSELQPCSSRSVSFEIVAPTDIPSHSFLFLPAPLDGPTCRTDVSSPLFHTLLPLYALFLLPTFHHLWLYSGSGNSNFFYASTLVWAIAMGGCALEAMGAWGKREVVLKLGKEGRDRVRKGQWGVVQR